MAYLNFVLLLALVLVSTTYLAQGADIDLGIDVQANVYCTVNGNAVTGRPNTGVANANVTLWCGNNTIASAITNNKGGVSISANASVDKLLLVLQGGCLLNASLPIANCRPLNVTGALVADVQVGDIVRGLPQILFHLVPGLFRLVGGIV